MLILFQFSNSFGSCCRSVDAIVPTEVLMVTTNQLAVVQQDRRGFGGQAQLTICGHAFCKVCLNSWKSTSPTCPICRFDLSGSQERLLYYGDRVVDTKCIICWNELKFIGTAIVAISE